jgi:hypothetical protein
MAVARIRATPEEPRSVLRFEIALPGPAHRADPVIGKILEGGSCRNGTIGIAVVRVVHIAADRTEITQ